MRLRAMPTLMLLTFLLLGSLQFHPRSLEADISDFGDFAGVYDLVPQPIRAFSQVDYWVEATLANGGSYTSPQRSFFYTDNRYQWLERKAGEFRVFWRSEE